MASCVFPIPPRPWRIWIFCLPGALEGRRVCSIPWTSASRSTNWPATGRPVNLNRTRNRSLSRRRIVRACSAAPREPSRFPQSVRQSSCSCVPSFSRAVTLLKSTHLYPTRLRSLVGSPPLHCWVWSAKALSHMMPLLLPRNLAIRHSCASPSSRRSLE